MRKKDLRMIDISGKSSTKRVATAEGKIKMAKKTLNMILNGEIPKGDVLGAAKIAGIMAAKKVPDLIPMCHPIEITGVDIKFAPDKAKGIIGIISTVSCVGKTGVEMEALTAATVSALTIYDMCKMVDKDMVISDIMLIEKSGGKSGHYKRRKS